MKKLLPVYPWPMHKQIAEALELFDNVKPIEAKPGGLNPVLSIRKKPTWACDAVVVMEPKQLSAGVAICVADGIELMTMASWLSEQFKVPVVEFR